MITAHLPAGYLLTKLISGKFEPARKTSLWFCALTASILPDIDILWFYIEGGLRNHRYYPTHWPLLWLSLFSLSVMALALAKRRDLIIYPAVILANVMLHLLLDCLAGPVFYAAPFSWERAQLIRVPAIYDWWVWNFLRHWVFQLELMIWSAAALVYGLSSWEKKTYV